MIATPSQAAPPTVLQDDAVLLHSTDDGVREAMAEVRALGIDRVRITAGWSVLAPSPDSPTIPADFDATDPAAYPHLIWRNLDRAVRDANQAGLSVDIDIAFWAPRWATSDPSLPTGRWRTNINPQLYAQFAQAVARRYSGSYTPPPDTPPASSPTAAAPAPAPPPAPDPSPANALLGLVTGPSGQQQQQQQQQQQPAPPPAPPAPPPPAPTSAGDTAAATPLPAVDMFTIWNEPNQPGFVMPQWRQEGGVPIAGAADIYRAMVQAAYPVIKAAAPQATVLVGGTASIGSNQPGRGAVPPLTFLRRLACVDTRLRPISSGACASYKPLPGDGWAHHPYSLLWLPNWVPHNPDMAPVGATARLTSMLRRLVQMGRIAAADANVYMTEYGYGTNPPDPQARFGLADQLRNIAWAENIALRDPAVKLWPQFLLRDRPDAPAGPQMRAFGDWHTGLFFSDGSPKPAAAAFRVPTFAQYVSDRGRRFTMIWGRLRGAGGSATSTIQASADDQHWQGIASAPSARRNAASASAARAPDGVITRFLPYDPRLRYRLVWTDAGGATITSAPTTPVSAATAPRRRGHGHR